MHWSDLTGVVLAGGRSRRMGADKALLTIDGDAFLGRVLAALQEVFPSVLISAGDRDRYA